MTRALDALERTLRWFGNAVLLLLACVICLQVVARYAFAFSPIWSEEFSRLLLIWTVMIGAAISVRQRSHIRVDVLLSPLPAKVRRIWFMLLDALALVLFVVLVVAGINAVTFNHSMRSLGLQWPMSVLIAAVPIGFAFAAVFLAEVLWRREDRVA
jgi:TRAP-type C4-dicarboxylate transport system permease small subunit